MADNGDNNDKVDGGAVLAWNTLMGRQDLWLNPAEVDATDMLEPIFLPGEPPTFNFPPSKQEREWAHAIRERCPITLTHPRLQFVVGSWKRRGHYFDLDNMAQVVLRVIGKDTESVWASVTLGQEPGVWISEELPVLHESMTCSLRIETPPVQSVRRTEILRELAGHQIIGTHEPLGLSLAFDSPTVKAGDFRLDGGPIKPVIDALGPVLGTYQRRDRVLPCDHRIHEIQVTKGHRPEAHGVTIGLWVLDSVEPN